MRRTRDIVNQNGNDSPNSEKLRIVLDNGAALVRRFGNSRNSHIAAAEG